MRGRWQRMTPEERERFRTKMKEWAGAPHAPADGKL
jgi:hypothetical protein